MAQEKRAREALTSELAEARQASDDVKAEAESARREKATLTEDLAKAKQSYQALSNELTTLRQAKEALEKRVKEMLAARAKEAERIVVTPPAVSVPAASGPITSVPAASRGQAGKVLVVNREFNFVVANLGSRDGIRAGTRYEILRNGQRIATAEVEKIYDNMSAANLLQEEKKSDVKEGDEVRLIS